MSHLRCCHIPKLLLSLGCILFCVCVITDVSAKSKPKPKQTLPAASPMSALSVPALTSEQRTVLTSVRADPAPEEIIQAIQEVMHGGAPMSSYVARKVVQSFRKPMPGGSQGSTEELSKRESEVLSLVARGYANKEVAEALGLSFETVRSYLKTIYSKLHVRSRTEAAMKFREKQ